MREPNSAIVWQGPSAFDHAPIVAIVTSLDARSHNLKTGPMAQLWILRSDVPPIDAAASGADGSICGDCGLRGIDGEPRGCYVILAHGPQAVYRKFRDGGYETIAPELIALRLRYAGLALRLGAYGDPAALPLWLLQSLTNVIARHTGYTHAWRTRPDLARYLMASADSPADVAHAHALGFRTFRTRAPEQPLLPDEISCPAADESGNRTTCERCNLCDGSRVNDRRRSVAILAHGTTTVHALAFIRRIA